MKHTTIVFLLLIAYYCNAQIYHTDFEYHEVGTNYSASSWEADGFAPRWLQGSERTMIDDQKSYSGQKSLRIFYPQGKYGTAETGTQTPLQLSPKNEYYASYRLRFSEDFSWGTTQFGGKLPGLTAGGNCSGCQTCTGTNGFSARFMWRPGGRAALYLYHMDKATSCGEDHYLTYPDGEPVYFNRGEWLHIAQRVKINTASNHDGEVEVWVNGQQVLFLQGLRFVNNGSLIDNFYISTFHGGDTPNWAPTVDSYLWLDDLVISDQYKDVAFQECQQPDLGPDQVLCDVNDLTLTSSLTGPAYSFQWLKDGQNLSGKTNSSISINQSGQYILILDSLGCFTRDTILVRNTLMPNLGQDRTICSSSFESLDPGLRGEHIEYTWYRDNQLLAHSSPVLKTSQAGVYKIQVNSPECGVATSQVKLQTGLLSISNDTVCIDQTAYLKVNEQGSFNWYDKHNTLVGDGNTFETIVEQSAIYYVKDANAFAGYVGKKGIDKNAQFTENRWDRQMQFTIHKQLRIESLEIDAVDNQDVVITIKKPNGDVIHSKTFDGITAGKHRLMMDMELQPGQYLMSAEGSTGKLWISNELDENIHFPYQIDGLITISGSNIAWINEKPYYLFFYNWEITSGNVCAPTPVEIVLNDDCIISGTLQNVKEEYSVYPNPSETSFSIETFGNNLLEVYNLQGNRVENLHFTDKTKFGEGLEQGVYFYRVSNKKGMLIGSGKLIRN
jgi:hypothetical protein